MSFVLLVIDMQKTFKASEKVLTECLDEIYRANKTNCEIVFLEFWFSRGAQLSDHPEGKTHPVLIQAAKHKHIVYKYEQDGSRVVSDFLREQFGYIPPLRICGVNTEFCVLDTVRGLARQSQSGLVVASQACHSLYNHKIGLRLMKKLNNVLVC